MEGIYNVFSRINEIRNKINNRQFDPVNKIHSRQQDFYNLLSASLLDKSSLSKDALEKDKGISVLADKGMDKGADNLLPKVGQSNLESSSSMDSVLNILKSKVFGSSGLDSLSAYDKFK